jgi:hypothetical protein
MKAFLGIFLVIFDLLKLVKIPNPTEQIKHFFLVQSWWRVLLILIFAGLIGFGYNVIGAVILIGLTIWFLLNKQEKYAIKNGTWNSIEGNDHFIVPSILSIVMMILLQAFLVKNAIPKYEIIKNITLNEQTVTDKAWVYLDIDGISVKLDTGSGCKWGNKVNIYKETRKSVWLNSNLMGSYHLECYKPIKKYTKL